MMNLHTRLQKTLKIYGIILFLGTILFFVYIHFGFGIPCLFHSITGFLCPGCGMTRAIVELLQGHPKRAFEYNALSVSVFPLLILYLIYRRIRYILHGEQVSYAPWEHRFLSILLTFTIGYCLWHNFQ